MFFEAQARNAVGIIVVAVVAVAISSNSLRAKHAALKKENHEKKGNQKEEIEEKDMLQIS